jgi:hypothetical protein
MHTSNIRQHRRIKQSALLAELPPSDEVELMAILKPTVDRIRNGELTLQLDGCGASADHAALFRCRFLELMDLIEGRC